MRKTISTALIGALLMPLSATAQAPSMMRIGAAGAVAGKVQALSAAAGAVGRVIESGQPLYLNDKISTDAQGRLQVLLQDETVFTIGPNSSMVLDEFVYNPSNGAGKVTARILKGFFRFVSGAIARKRPDDMSIKTPVGVIGIRGTIGGGQVGDNNVFLVLLGPKEGNNAGNRKGQLTFKGLKGGSQTLLQPGSGLNADQNGVGKPFKVPKGQLDAFLTGLNGNPPPSGKGQDGSAGKTQGFNGSKDSGQDTGKGLDNLNDTRDATASLQGANNLLASLNQNFLVDGPANWDQVRTIETGTGMFSGSGVFTQTKCSGSACTFIGSSTVNLAIDFGARTVGGGSSSIFVTGTNFISTTGGNINTTSFASLSGTATFTPSISVTTGSGNFSGTTMTLQNQNGTVAGALQVDVKVTAVNDAGAGSYKVQR